MTEPRPQHPPPAAAEADPDTDADNATEAGQTAGAGPRAARDQCLILCRASTASDVPALLASCAAGGLHAHWVHPAQQPPAPRSAAALAIGRTVILPRLPSGTPVELLLGLQAWERAGARVLNPAGALRTAHDKAACLAALAAAGLPVPPTLCIVRDGPSSIGALPGADRPGQLFVVKPASGSSGRGVTVGIGRAEAERRAAAFADASGPVLVQPFLGGGIDRRLFVVGEVLVAAMERRPAPGLGRGNLAYGAQAGPIEPSAAESALALRAARALGLHVAAVDLLIEGNEPLVLEVNSSPGLTGISRITGVDVAAAITGFMGSLLAPPQ